MYASALPSAHMARDDACSLLPPLGFFPWALLRTFGLTLMVVFTLPSASTGRLHMAIVETNVIVAFVTGMSRGR